jgi:vacuolar-type H+-ATPase subunit H
VHIAGYRYLLSLYRVLFEVLQIGARCSGEHASEFRTLMTERLTPIVSQARDTGRQIVSQATERGRQILSQASERGGQILSQAGERGREVVSQARDHLQEAGRAVSNWFSNIFAK